MSVVVALAADFSVSASNLLDSSALRPPFIPREKLCLRDTVPKILNQTRYGKKT
jgi:hypothetical protein